MWLQVNSIGPDLSVAFSEELSSFAPELNNRSWILTDQAKAHEASEMKESEEEKEAGTGEGVFRVGDVSYEDPADVDSSDDEADSDPKSTQGQRRLDNFAHAIYKLKVDTLITLVTLVTLFRFRFMNTKMYIYIYCLFCSLYLQSLWLYICVSCRWVATGWLLYRRTARSLNSLL